MKELKYWFAKVFYKIHRNNPEVMSDYFRKAGMRIGGGCNICCNIMTAEPYLVEIGNNVTISGNVTFVTHDNSISKCSPNCANLFGYIRIGNNCFIGQNATILYGCSLADNIIVAAGSCVCNSFLEEGIIIGGNPARKISDVNTFFNKNRDCAMRKVEAINAANNCDYSKFIVRKEK